MYFLSRLFILLFTLFALVNITPQSYCIAHNNLLSKKKTSAVVPSQKHKPQKHKHKKHKGDKKHNTKSGTNPSDTSAKAKKDSTEKKDDSPLAKLIKEYKTIQKDSTKKIQKGLFTIYTRKEKYLLEIPDSMLETDFLVTSRLAKSGSGMRSANPYAGYAGDLTASRVIRFSRTPNRKIFIKEMSYSETGGNPKDEMYTSVQNSNLAPVIASLDALAMTEDSSALIVDITSYLNSDANLFFNPSIKKMLKIAGLQSDKSYIKSVRTFPMNLSFSMFKTYTMTENTISNQKPSTQMRNVSMEIITSLIALPKKPMQARYFDERVGYFTRQITDFNVLAQGVKKVRYITRWRLEPKPEDSARYARGELVAPKKPIVFYIDPATPKKWVPYLIQGVQWWQAAFEQAGFKNAIQARRAPTKEEDSTWSLEDARFSAIIYKPSAVANASGPHIHDPRSGEILESHINWYHNIMELLREWYMLQCGQSDSTARGRVFPDTLMGKLIAYVAAHEVGHTLGLRHNWGASHAVPVEKLRDKNWVLKNGITPSIMDYSRFNYVAQAQDSMPQDANMPRAVGIYDKWAIDWGYRLFPRVSDPAQELDTLNARILSHAKDPRFWFGRERQPTDPRSQNEDLGDDAVRASTYGIKNLQTHILPNLITWINAPHENYDELEKFYDALLRQYNYYIGHVSKYIAGVEETPQTSEQEGTVFEPLTKQAQQRALRFLDEQVFNAPTWILPAAIANKIGINYEDKIVRIQKMVLNKILRPEILYRMYDIQKQFPEKKTNYLPTEYVHDLNEMIFKELFVRPSSVSLYRRVLQRLYVENLINLSDPSEGMFMLFVGASASKKDMRLDDATDLAALAKGTLRKIKNTILQKRKTFSYDQATQYHLEDLVDKITRELKRMEK